MIRNNPGIKGLFFSVLLLIFNLSSFGQEWIEELNIDTKSDLSFQEIREAAEEQFKHQKKEYFARKFKITDNPELNYQGIRDYIEFKRWEEYWENHVDKNGRPVNPLKEYKEFRNFLSNASKGPETPWVNINRRSAPGGYWGMGRIREIAFHPTNPDIFWAGADQGGIWKTTDNGLTYTPIADDLPFLKVSSICVNHENPDIIYMSGGGTDGGWWDRTIGVYKTTDGGDTWQPTGLNAHLSEYESYRRLAMSPDNPDVLLVTGREGIYRTTDGGQHWTKTTSGDYYDLVFNPENGNIVFAAYKDNIKKSEDGGQTWYSVTDIGYGGYMRNIAISPVNADYMVAELDTWIDNVRHSVIYASTDGGESWTRKALLDNDPGGTIGFSSSDTLTVYRGWTKIFKSTNLGETWYQKTNWYWNGVHDEVHADHFRIKKNPLIEDRLYFCNDGGVYIYNESDDEWLERTAGLIISQYYCISSSQSDPQVLLAGSQDNGGWYRNKYGNWRTTNGGDGMHTWQHPTNNNIGFSSYPGGKIYRTTNGWSNYYSVHTNIDPEPQGGDWNSRYAVDPNDFDIIVTGCYPSIYRSADRGNTWNKIGDNLAGGSNFHCITIPETNSDYIYASSGSRLYRTTDGGASWKSFYPSTNKIKGIAVSPYNHNHIWVVTGGYSEGQKVFMSRNGGDSWENISGSLPNLPALSVIYEKGTNDGIYIGMTYGVYYRNNTMDDWTFYGYGIPNCEIRHLDIQYETGKIRCATYGRGIYETDLYPVDIEAPEAYFEVSPATICIGDTLIFENKSKNSDNIIWDFGDGSSSRSDTVYHVYDTPGEYMVKLTAFNSLRADTYTANPIRISPYIDARHVGPNDITIGSKRVYTGESAGIVFNVGFPTIIKSFMTYAASKGMRKLYLIDSEGRTLFSKNVNLNSGMNGVELEVEVPPGNDYVLKFEGTTNLIMNTDGAKYPYNPDGLFSITGNTNFNRKQYYFFYHIWVQHKSCDQAELPDVEKGVNVAIDEILIYPNPVKDKLFIDIRGFTPEDDLEIRISNLNGNTIYQKDIYTQRKIELNRSDLGKHSGILILEVSGPGKKTTSQIIRM